ncbi:porin family protein [Rufibacter roseus]|uniref:Porin family protein n=1 Tax=Rufibacter roseus TaxID=1567108 RepID=A0ABW2DGM7_9BACT|nr:porin family protein [Rufibacter roseus]
MKKLLLFVVALFTISFAQAQGGIKLGLKAGGNLSNITGDDTEDSKNKFGFHVGGFVDFGVSDMVSIRPEVLYSMKGATGEGDGDSDMSLNLNYIDVPIMARINADKLFFEFGPTISFLVKSEAEMGDLSVDFKDYTNTVDFGYAAGLGYNISDNIGLGLRYNGGLSKVFKDNEDADFGDVRNSVFQLSLSFSLGGR